MKQLQDLVKQTVERLYNLKTEVELTRTEEQFGDYATNVALQLGKQLSKNPREVADNLVSGLSADFIKKVEVAGPGFINIFLVDSALLKLAEQDLVRSRQGDTNVIETNNSNPFKAMHIGHAFNAILADTVANLLETSGAQTHRVSYHGDVGAHVGKSMYSLLKFIDGNPDKLESVTAQERNSFMSKMYADGSKAYEDDPEAKQAIDHLAQESFTRQDPTFAKVYGICLQWSLDDIDHIVSELGNKPIEKRYLESQADSLGVEAVKSHTPGVFTESDGAYVFLGSKYGTFDNVFVSSKGRGLYAARDLGLMQLKYNDFHPKKSYIVTAVEQKDYFKGVIKAAELCLPDLADQTVNISTGTVKLSSGKMSSRSGEVLEISWLFDQIKQAIIDQGGAVTDEVIAGALRYQFLKVRIGSDVIFDVDESVSLQGNSGPYLQYAYARANSILSKVAPAEATLVELEPQERSLLRKIGEFAEVADRATIELMPHHICTYLYDLAQTFNRFYENSRVVGDQRQGLRLKLVAMYADKLKEGLSLLGIAAPDKM